MHPDPISISEKKKRPTENEAEFSVFLFPVSKSRLPRSLEAAQRSLARLTANISEHRGKVIQKL